MDVTQIVNIALPIVLVVVGIALVVFIVELTRMVKSARAALGDAMDKVNPILEDTADMTKSLKPAVAKVDPLVDRAQLTLDAVNLELIRVDDILEDVSKITDSASSATAAVDSITNAPIKAVSNVTTRMRTALANKNAGEESAQIPPHSDDVAQALADFRAAEDEDGQDEVSQARRSVEEALVAMEELAEKSSELAEETGEAAADAAGVVAEERSEQDAGAKQ